MNHDTEKRLLHFTYRERILLGGMPTPMSDVNAGALLGVAENALLRHEDDVMLIEQALEHDSVRNQLDRAKLQADARILGRLTNELADARRFVVSAPPARVA